ncbi:MAG: CDP-diacylglycerol--glycerol-3-phosphate 3-phosphatidyltransferase [Clostridia bacterium]|nr:CDP-diacylglycerol--glycerol-3-phosphate 3-phosphatidyltransferase [Clostridia bacterium]
MNLPNALTVLRIILIPVFAVLWFMQTGSTVYSHFLWAAIVFLIASATDFLDGRIARKHGKITNFGKIADPIADKALTVAAYFCIYAHLRPRNLTAEYITGIVFVCVILAREIAVTVMRMIYLRKGVALSAGLPGKIKTFAQMVLLFIAMLFIYSNEKSYTFVGSDTLSITKSVNVLVFIIMILTVFSGVYYFAGAKKGKDAKNTGKYSKRAKKN